MTENNVNKGLEERLTVQKGEFFVHKSVPGEHTFNTEEFSTMNKIKQYKMLKEIRDEELQVQNDGLSQYYIVENGFVLKYQKDTFLCKKLDTERMEWIDSPELVSIFFDSALKFQELVDFEDYFPDADPSLNNGRHL